MFVPYTPSTYTLFIYLFPNFLLLIFTLYYMGTSIVALRYFWLYRTLKILTDIAPILVIDFHVQFKVCNYNVKPNRHQVCTLNLSQHTIWHYVWPDWNLLYALIVHRLLGLPHIYLNVLFMVNCKSSICRRGTGCFETGSFGHCKIN